MTGIRVSAWLMGMALFVPATASAQYLVPVAPLPVVAARPVLAPAIAPVRYYAARPVVVAPTVPVVQSTAVARVSYSAPVTTTTVAPAPVTVVARPVTASSTVVVARPATPVVTSYYAPVYAPTVFARPAVVRPKVYYPGQPIRNTFRAVTP